MPTSWLQSGSVVIDSTGRLLLCISCPCGAASPFPNCPCPDVSETMCGYPPDASYSAIVPLVYDALTDRWTGEGIYCIDCLELPPPVPAADATFRYSVSRVRWALYCQSGCPLAATCWVLEYIYHDYTITSGTPSAWQQYNDGYLGTGTATASPRSASTYLYPRSGGVGYLCNESVDDNTGTGTGSSGHTLFRFVSSAGYDGHDAPGGYCLVSEANWAPRCGPSTSSCSEVAVTTNSIIFDVGGLQYKPSGDPFYGAPQTNRGHVYWKGSCQWAYGLAPTTNNSSRVLATISGGILTFRHEGKSTTGVSWYYEFTSVSPIDQTGYTFLYYSTSSNVLLQWSGSALLSGSGTGASEYLRAAFPCSYRHCDCNPILDTIYATITSDCAGINGLVVTLSFNYGSAYTSCIWNGTLALSGSKSITITLTTPVGESGNDTVRMDMFGPITGTVTVYNAAGATHSCSPLTGSLPAFSTSSIPFEFACASPTSISLSFSE